MQHALPAVHAFLEGEEKCMQVMKKWQLAR